MAETKKKGSGTRKTTSKTNQKSPKEQGGETRRMTAAERQEALYKKRLVHDEISAVIIIVLGIILLIMSVKPDDSGIVGGWVNSFLFGIFGKAAYAIPYFMIFFGALIFTRKMALLTVRSWVAIILLFVAAGCMFSVSQAALCDGLSFKTVGEFYRSGRTGGGIFGTVVAYWLIKAVGKVVLYLICIAMIIVSLLFVINTPISSFFDQLKIKRQAARKQREEEREQAEEYEAKVKAEQASAPKTPALPQHDQAPSGGILPGFLERAKQESERKKKEAIVSLAAKEYLEEKPEKNKEEKPEATEKAPSEDHKTEIKEEQKPAAENCPEPEPPEEEPEIAPVYTPPVVEYTPESIGRKTSHSIPENQQKILDYVADDTLFAGREKPAGYGLNGDPQIPYQNDSAKEASSAKPQKSTENPVSADAEAEKTQSAPDQQIKPAAAVPASAQQAAPPTGYVFPPIDLLKKPAPHKKDGSEENQLADQAKLLEETLASFGVSAKVVDMVKGPAVTRFEVQPATGVKVSRITSLQDDLALNLRAKSLRIEAPIPGKAAVGIEISNDSVSSVLLREIIESKEFKTAKSKISVGLGRGISGDSVVANLKDMPHLLIAGATGSGKSVCINSILISLIYKAKPDEVKLILVDPKVVELSCYNGIPHLMVPVVTEPAKAAAALGWAVTEMNDRYNRFAERGVRDLQSYNESVRADGEEELVMPQIVIIIDELADLIMAAQNQVEDYICRLAQKARAAGMHLIVATQRPSVDVITGVIKANIPSRIAFAVSSQIDSRTILDMAGAEKLVGKGDMLYSPQGISKPVRVQGSFVSDNEVNNIIDFVKINCQKVEYSDSVTNAMDKAGVGPAAAGDEENDLLTDAIECVVRAQLASVSSIQRRFRIGYNRAARLIDEMEERGIVGPADGSRPRKVLMTIEQFEECMAKSEPVEDEIP